MQQIAGKGDTMGAKLIWGLSLVAALAVVVGCKRAEQSHVNSTAAPSTITLVNIIPEAMSGETHQDSEPNLAVKPGNTQHIAASAFTRNPAGFGNAPIFVSSDGGNVWSACATVQSDVQTGDITLRFTDSSERLYAGILRLPGGLRLNIQSTDDFLDCGALMNVHVDRDSVDQPYVQASDSANLDRVFVGHNDFNPTQTGRTASIDMTLDDAATFSTSRIESRATTGQDLPPIRPAIGPNNVIYAAFIARRPGGAEVVVVRDDAGGGGATPFRALVDADGDSGVRVATGRNVPFENEEHPDFGQERLVSSDLSIAVDATDAARVCVAWGDRQPGSPLTLHLRCSTDSGRTWTAGTAGGSNPDLRTVASSKAPAIAFNTDGVLGFLYQEFVNSGGNQRWITHFERLKADFTPQDDTVLARTPADAPAPQFIPYLGDYVHLMAVGDTFYGIFSANNTPDRNNFLPGVVYQRRHNFTTRTLQDLAGATVPVSIDPFFFTAR